MAGNTRGEIDAAFAALRTAVDGVLELEFDALGTGPGRRRQRHPQHGPARPRRAQHRPAGTAGQRQAGTAQRAAGQHHRQHHAAGDYATSGRTDVDELAFACPPDHHLNTPGGWRTRKRANGDTEWIPPPHLDDGQPRVNRFHHRERLLRGITGDDDEDAA